MRHAVRGFAVALALVAGLAAAMPSVVAAPADRVALFVKAKLSRDSVIGLLMLAISAELAKLEETMEALYEAGYIATASGGVRGVERIFGSIATARYGTGASDDMLAAMMEYLKMVAREAREDRAASGRQLANATRRIVVGLDADELARFATDMRDWLEYLADCVRGLRDAELDMLQLQSLVSQRQQAIQLTTNLIAALGESTKTIAGNAGGGGGGQSGSLSEGGAGSEPAPGGGCPPCGCSCP